MGCRITGEPDKIKTLWSSLDFLGLGADAGVRALALAALEKFTVGSCGPRGFYGTTSAHLTLESDLASFLSFPEAITYSDMTATVASVIPAFAKRGDVLLIDAGVSWGVQQGARLSRSKVVWWEHNDLRDLESKLSAVRAADNKGKKTDATQQRRFIVVEGISASTGGLCDLKGIVALAKEFKWRIILDDSLALGVLGATGRGSVEHWKVEHDDVHVTVGALSTTLGSVGGFCLGSADVVDHQRLSGASYCFSASAPPYLCAAASAALRALKADPSRVDRLHKKSLALHAALLGAGMGANLALISDPVSPIKHLVLADTRNRAPQSPAAACMLSPTSQRLPAATEAAVKQRLREESTLDEIIRECAAAGTLLTRSHTLAGEPFPARPALKIAITLRHTDADIKQLVATLKSVAESVV